MYYVMLSCVCVAFPCPGDANATMWSYEYPQNHITLFTVLHKLMEFISAVITDTCPRVLVVSTA